MDPKKKFYLFYQSKNFCSVPWNQFKVSMRGDISTCTFGTELLGNLSDTSIDDILKNKKLKDIQNSLYNEIETSNCKKCRSYENYDNKYKYLRDLYNPMYVKSDVDYSNNDVVLSGIDLHWSSLCDLKCITCWAQQSSSIAIEQGLPVLHTPTAEANKLIDYIIKNQHTLKEIYLSGGEPTLNKHNLRLLEKIEKREDLQIRINTNMMFSADNLIIEELKKFPNVLFTISAEEIGNRFNYIRRGANWDTFLSNLKRLSSYHFKWRVNSTFFVCSALNLLNLFKFFEDNYSITNFTINQLDMGHTVIRSRNLPDLIKDRCLTEYTKLHSETSDNNLKGQLSNCILELTHPRDESYSDYLDKIDLLANSNWRKTFPELT